MKKRSARKTIIFIFLMQVCFFFVQDAWNSMPIVALGFGIGALVFFIAAINTYFPDLFDKFLNRAESHEIKQLSKTVEEQKLKIKYLEEKLKEKDSWGDF